MTSPNEPPVTRDELVIALTPPQIGVLLAVLVVLVLLRRRKRAS